MSGARETSIMRLKVRRFCCSWMTGSGTYALKPRQSQNARGVFACLRRHVHIDPNADKRTHSATHPERPVRRGWRGQAGVRSTWPPLLTACCRRSQLKSVFCWRMPESAPSTVALFTQDYESGCSLVRCLRKAVRERKKKLC